MAEKKKPEDSRDVFEKALDDPFLYIVGGGLAGGLLGRRLGRGARKKAQRHLEEAEKAKSRSHAARDPLKAYKDLTAAEDRYMGALGRSKMYTVSGAAAGTVGGAYAHARNKKRK